MNVRTFERLAKAGILCGLTSILFALMLAVGPLWTPSAGETATARARLTTARVLRTEGQDTTRFDTVMSSLSAGIGYDTPAELAPSIDLIRTARTLETVLGHRTDETDRTITQAFGLAERTLDDLQAKGSVFAPPTGPRAALSLWATVVAFVLITTATILNARALAGRRAERAAIAQRLSLSPVHADDGTLDQEVWIYVQQSASRTHTVETSHETVVRTAGVGTSPPTLNSPPAQTPRPALANPRREVIADREESCLEDA